MSTRTLVFSVIAMAAAMFLAFVYPAHSVEPGITDIPTVTVSR